MILNLLDLSKADEGKLAAKVAELDLRALVDAVTGEIDVAAREREVTFHVALETNRIVADEDLLRRTLANLVENAIRHAPRQTIVRIVGTRGEGVTELRVADAGAGIPPAMRERIFDPFVQLDQDGLPPSRSGRGLGLTFCRLAVEAHGGTIRIEDGKPGAVFAMRIPDAR
jgi:signal transduction histidine kinase